MDTTPIYDRKTWNALSHDAAQELLQHMVATQLPGFTIKSFETFRKFDQHTYTAVMDHEGSEFVFVPGDTVTLGLNSWSIAENNKINLLSFFNNNEAELDQYILERMSPLRTATIGPMIVERCVQSTGFFPAAMDDPRLLTDKYFEEALRTVQSSEREKYMYTVHNSFRLEKDGDTIRALLYFPSSHEEIIQSFTSKGFRLPTEDEWEYLCGGGSRTLFPWGDHFDHDQKYHHFMTAEDSNSVPYLDTPNQFGLVIANDPYHYEIMMDSEQFLKSGDGGCNICGGGGIELGYLPVSTYYRDPYIFDDAMEYKAEITGDYTYTRRIKRLE
ncbi:SUMF1/EgtB/PvdO family nonheme iron enzyme [Chitinophaga vietnamensis]|uniref:SUMF1/EgtB/PvdO family nonheme iron enzyme n=1 Tax=Chitinophaga vietnamensis TaxID=2593957 RepID=UPI001177B906|nr:SUMF1/EgtB/PvdO family nonheme iron enzyme [Chitinophaga vietnamensis]